MSLASAEENKKAARYLIEEIYQNGNLDLIDEVLAEHAVDHEEFAGGQPINAREALSIAARIFRSAFPDLTVTIEDETAEGDKVFQRTTWKGTHQGEFMGIQPTGRSVSFSSMDEIRFRDGKIIEHWGVTDSLGLMIQLGAVELPG